MKRPFPTFVELCRTEGPPNSDFGVFRMLLPECRVRVLVIASSEIGWDHVSVSHGLPNKRKKTVPWHVMDEVRRWFFKDDETVIQLHPPIVDHISPGSRYGVEVLHLWRPHDVEIPLPPKVFV